MKQADDLDERLILVGGLHRSGTSLVGGVLAQHPDCSGIVGTEAIQDEGQFLQNVYPLPAPDRQPGFFGLDPAAHLTEASEFVSEENAAQLLECWSSYWDLDSRFLIEKSPPNMLRARFFAALFPRAQFVFTLRHPLVVALATQRWSKTSLTALVDHSLLCYRTMLQDLLKLERWVIVRFESLEISAPTVFHEVGSHLGLPDLGSEAPALDPAVRQRYANAFSGPYRLPRLVPRVARLSVGRGISVLPTGPELEYVLQRFGPEFGALGYEADAPMPLGDGGVLTPADRGTIQEMVNGLMGRRGEGSD